MNMYHAVFGFEKKVSAETVLAAQCQIFEALKDLREKDLAELINVEVCELFEDKETGKYLPSLIIEFKSKLNEEELGKSSLMSEYLCNQTDGFYKPKLLLLLVGKERKWVKKGNEC